LDFKRSPSREVADFIVVTTLELNLTAQDGLRTFNLTDFAIGYEKLTEIRAKSYEIPALSFELRDTRYKLQAAR
jgi:hypothetical protein